MANFITNGTFITDVSGWTKTHSNLFLTRGSPSDNAIENGYTLLIMNPMGSEARGVYQAITGLTDDTKDVELTFWARVDSYLSSPSTLTVSIQDNDWHEDITLTESGNLYTVTIPKANLPITEIRFECPVNWYIDNIFMDYAPDRTGLGFNFIDNGTFTSDTTGWFHVESGTTMTSTTAPSGGTGNTMELTTNTMALASTYTYIIGMNDTSKDGRLTFWYYGTDPITVYIQDNVWYESVSPDTGATATLIIPKEHLPITKVKIETWAASYDHDAVLYLDDMVLDYRPLDSGTDITAFTMAEQDGSATIDNSAHTVFINVAYGTTLTALVSTFTLSTNATATIGATSQVSGSTANNFTSPVVYTVTAEDASTEDWTVTVTVSPPPPDLSIIVDNLSITQAA